MQKKIIYGRVVITLLLFFTIHVNANSIDGKSFDNWTARCEKQGDMESCFIFQNLVLKKGGSRLLHIAVGYLSSKKKIPVILISMPLGISLPPGASIKVDDQEPIKFQIERCEHSGCRGGFKLKESMLKSFSEGKKAVVTFHDGLHEAINVPITLAGLSDGLKALKL